MIKPVRRTLGIGLTVIATLGACATVAAAQPSAAPSVSLHAVPAQRLGIGPVTLSGTAVGVVPGSTVTLFRSAYPYSQTTLLRSTTTSADGSFAFTVYPDRNTRYRVQLVGGTASATVQVGVVGVAVTKVRAQTPGKARVTIVVFHPRDLRWSGAHVSWWFATGRHGRFVPAPSTRTVRLSPYAAVLWTTITLPAGPFRFRACFHAPGDRALLDLRRPPGCTGRGFQGGGSLPVGFPGPAAIARAEAYLSGRIGRTALAVVDSQGRLSGVHEHWTFITGSVVKAMLLVAYLRRLDAMGQHTVDAFSNSFLYPMINVSDNSAATQTWSIVGDAGLYSVAGAAGMTEFSISGIWANAQISAADQAKFFFEMDSLIPHEFVGYARFLLSTIAGYESWGIPAVARPLGYQVFFKGGWRGTGLGQLVHQIGRLEGHRHTFSLAVMTDGDPSMGYGIDTIQGVTGALLG
ncbi:MAG: hypothetical protein JO206_09900 [Solirubrobacterales bacterium]|nr:hypothetical protein [Solirubrobacterales bacterium]MBV9473270.1 hypothetical protein [Solirubrobacterales bacterium]